MKESDVRRAIHRMLRYRYNLWPDHWPDIAGVKEAGRPDLVVMNPRGPGFYIEVKAIFLNRNTSFNFSSIEDSQRRWLTTWEEQRPNGSYLAIGTICRNRSIFIIPWLKWLAVEDMITPIQRSLPYKVGPGYKKHMQDNGLDFRLISKWKCNQVSTNEWALPKILENLMEVQCGAT